VVLAVGVLAVVGLTWAFAREAFLQHGHFVATIAFFALFAAVAVRSAFSGGSEGARPRAVFRMLYAVVAAGLALVLVAYVVLLPGAEAGELPIVLLAEGAALALFFVFWVVQGIEKWNEGDPTLVGR
jgi:hypothetical protein